MLLHDLTKALIDAARNAEQNPQPKPIKPTVHVHLKDVAHNVHEAIELGEYESVVQTMGDAFIAARERRFKELNGKVTL